MSLASAVPAFRCLRCQQSWEGHPCLTECRFCGHLYIEWVHFAAWRAHPDRAEYRQRLGEESAAERLVRARDKAHGAMFEGAVLQEARAYALLTRGYGAEPNEADLDYGRRAMEFLMQHSEAAGE